MIKQLVAVIVSVLVITTRGVKAKLGQLNPVLFQNNLPEFLFNLLGCHCSCIITEHQLFHGTTLLPVKML